MNETAEREEEISLVDIVAVFIRHKMLIIGGTILVTVIMFGIISSKPDIYKVSFVMELGNTDSGLVESPENLTSKIIRGYSFAAMRALKIPEKKFPKIMASNPEKTKHIEVALEIPKPSLGVEILTQIEAMLLKDHGKVFDKVKMDIDGTIKSVMLKMKAIDNENKILGKKLALIQKDKDVIKKQMIKIDKRINELLQEKIEIINKVGPDKSLSIFEVSNQIFQNRKYYNDLQVKINIDLARDEVGLREELLNNEIKRQMIELEKLKFKSKRDNLQKTIIIKEPSYKNIPINKKKKLLIISTFLVSLIGFSLLALLTELAKNLPHKTRKNRF